MEVFQLWHEPQKFDIIVVSDPWLQQNPKIQQLVCHFGSSAPRKKEKKFKALL